MAKPCAAFPPHDGHNLDWKAEPENRALIAMKSAPSFVRRPEFAPRVALLAVLSSAVSLAGCASFGPEHPPLASTTATALGLTDANSMPVALRWWTSLNDLRLNQLVDQALLGSPSLAVARARLDRAGALADISRASARVQANLRSEERRVGKECA